jgi:hypothetical protein
MSTHLTEVTFKDAVRTFIELHDEITLCTKGLRDLKKKKQDLSDAILRFMKDNSIDEFQVPDGKLSRKTSKRTEGVKKDHIINCLKSSLGSDEQAEAILQMINAQRNTFETESLRRSVQKG